MGCSSEVDAPDVTSALHERGLFVRREHSLFSVDHKRRGTHARAVSWATDDNTGKCFSGKGACAETVVFAALTAAGFGGLGTVARLGKAAEWICQP